MRRSASEASAIIQQTSRLLWCGVTRPLLAGKDSMFNDDSLVYTHFYLIVLLLVFTISLILDHFEPRKGKA